MGNIVIVCFLPNIAAAASQMLPATTSELNSTTTSELDPAVASELDPTTTSKPDSATSKPSPAAASADEVARILPVISSTANSLAPNDDSAPSDGHAKDAFASTELIHLQKISSGGSIIDFDYSRAKCCISNKASVSTSYLLFCAIY